MNEQKSELVSLRLPERHKTYLQRLAVSEGLTIAQWLRKQVCIQTWEAIEKTAELLAITDAALECNIPFKTAKELNSPEEALSIIPAEKRQEFKKRLKELYSDYLENEKEKAKFLGLEKEIKQINALRVTEKEWEESQEDQPKLKTIIDKRKKK